MALVVGFHTRQWSPGGLDVVLQFANEQLFRLVFQSNSLEGAGVSTLAETKKVAASALSVQPRLAHPWKDSRYIVRRLWASGSTRVDDLVDQILDPLFDDGDSADLPVVTFEERSRTGLEVVRHVLGVRHAVLRAGRFSLKRVLYLARKELQQPRPKQRRARGRWPDHWPPMIEVAKPRFIDQAFAKALHLVMAEDLIDPDQTEGVLAGKYRVDERGAGSMGSDRWFTTPSQIEPAMRKWIAQANRNALDAGVDPLFRACWVMHRFTEIHPFPDFNGRVGRLLMNASLIADNVPFAVPISSAAKWRRRYVDALKSADRGHYLALVTLIAHSIVDGFERLNAQLRAAGFAEIHEASIDTKRLESQESRWLSPGRGKRSEG